MIFFKPKTTIYVLLSSNFAAAIVKRPPVRDNEQKNGQGVLMKRKEGPGNNSKAIDQEALADQIALHLDRMETFFPEHESPDLAWDIVSSADEADLGDASLDDSDHDTVSVHSEDLHYFETEMDEIEDFIEEHPDFRSLQNTDPVSIHGSPEDSMEGSLEGSNSQGQLLD